MKPFKTHYRTCLGKVAHANKANAEAAIRSMQRGGRDVTGLQAYKCVSCGAWHSGNKPGARQFLVAKRLREGRSA